jgi:hypothetical protein
MKRSQGTLGFKRWFGGRFVHIKNVVSKFMIFHLANGDL